MKEKSTSFDIAYKAGVSQSTVSRALRNSPLVNEATREKIQAIAKELNYKVDKNASNLRSQQSDTIALLLFEDPTNDDSAINPFFLSMLGSITRACSQKGYDLLVSFQQASDDWHADFEDSNKADGLILLGYGDYVDYEEKLVKLLEQGTHFVRWGAEVKNLPLISVGCDNYQGGKEMTEHLIKKGRKNIAFLGSASTHAPEFFERYKGYCQSLKANGIVVNPLLQFNALYTEEAGYQAACQLISNGEYFDAICCACDLIAIGTMRALQEHNLDIPEQVALVGFDDIAIASFTFPPLTTVKQDTQLAGELLVNTLLTMISGEEAKTTLIPPELVIRKSCGS
ncbi:LacI family DNA-binding transcriptional regulator [Colwellia psychrerythraea]|uniref:Transcriptional regulator, LacI family n=1 Tax=Colwellia psychrerythraea TaxID=28229 RepID=A0A099KSY0_COLPS|nr:LacI family DNA-binding transcriptional regulator [Colwellia psychrerythraea]KGJ93315.1 transcriptional regulator, LacI family [Colwellia psychrerythraea]